MEPHKSMKFVIAIILLTVVPINTFAAETDNSTPNKQLSQDFPMKVDEVAPGVLTDQCTDYWNRKLEVKYLFTPEQGYLINKEIKTNILVEGSVFNSVSGEAQNYKILCILQPDLSAIHHLNTLFYYKLDKYSFIGYH